MEDLPNGLRGEILPARRFHCHLVQMFGDGCMVMVFGGQTLDRVYRARIGASSTDGNMQRLDGSALESKVSRNQLGAANQSDIFDQQPSHPFPLPVRRFRILPHFWKVIRQSQNLLPGVHRYRLSGQLQPLIFLFRFPHQA
jgi:hypothetical protein